MEIHTHSEFPLILIHLVPPLQNPSCCAPLLHNYPANGFDLFRCIYFLCDACAANLFQMYILCIFVQLSPDYLIILYIQRAVSLVRPPCCISVPRFNVKTNSDKFVHRQGTSWGCFVNSLPIGKPTGPVLASCIRSSLYVSFHHLRNAA
jgi:hypothetical protein